MFDFTSSKLLILGIVALLVIGPKELPGLLRTLGKYMGIIRRHANEFRAQFDEAMRESELEALKKEVETIGKDTEASIRSAEQTVQSEMDAARASMDTAMDDPAQKFTADASTPADPLLPVASGGGASGATTPLNGAGHPHEPEPAVETAGQPAHVPDKTGA
jgi:sec-independent protein translocase protein TatB